MNIDQIKLSTKLVKGNRNNILLISLAIGIILTPVVSVFMILDSNYESMFDYTRKQLNNNSREHIRVDIVYERNLLDFSPSIIDQHLNEINTTLSQVGLLPFIDTWWINHYQTFDLVNFSEIRNEGQASYYEENFKSSIRTLLLPGSEFPQNENETILVVSWSSKQLYELNSTYLFRATEANVSSAFPLKVVGILPLFKATDFDLYTNYGSYEQYMVNVWTLTGIKLHIDDVWRHGLLTRKTDYPSILRRIGQSSGAEPEDLIKRRWLVVNYRLNSTLLKARDVYRYISQLDTFAELLESQNPDADVQTKSIAFQVFLINWIIRQIEFMVMALPLMIISLSFTNYVYTKTNLFRLKRMRVLIIRGISLKMSLLLVLVESLVVLVLSYLLGFILGTILTLLLIIGTKAAPVFVIYPQGWFHYVFIVAIICIGLIYTRLTRSVIKTYSQDTWTSSAISERVKHRSWPVRILMLGVIAFLVSYIAYDIVKTKNLFISPEQYTNINNYLSLITILSVFATLIGLIFSLRTVFSSLIQSLSDRYWLRNNNIQSLALRNIKRYLKSSSDIWLFVTLLISFSFILMAYSTSIDQYFQLRAEFNTGADYKIDFQQTEENQLFDYINQNITELKAITRIALAQMQYRFESGTYWHVNLLGIDPTSFFEVALTNPQYGFSSPLSSLKREMTSLNSSVGASVGFLERERLSVGETYQLNLLGEKRIIDNDMIFYHPITNISIVSSFHMYPLISLSTEERGLIIHRDFLEGLKEVPDTEYSMTYSYLLRTTQAIPKAILTHLQDFFDVSITDAREEFQTIAMERSWDQFKSAQRTNVVIAMVLSSCCLIIFGMFQMVERAREHAIERAIGFKKREILFILIYEKMILIGSSILGGFLVGTLFSIVFLHWYSVFGVPIGLKPTIVIPIVPFLPYIVLFFLLMLISVIPPILMQQQFDIGSLLKRQETD